jgi:F-type H+-transporting ATPase subunit epsilon
MVLDVSVLSPRKVVFKGTAKSIILPGEQGVFEVAPFHKRILSRLISGTIFIDERQFSVKRGIVKVNQNKVTIIIEEAV